MQDLRNMESDNQKRIEEVQTLKERSTAGYPSKEQLVSFCYSIQAFQALQYSWPCVSHSGYHKLSEFDSFFNETSFELKQL